MKLLNAVYHLLSNGDADKEAAYNIADSFTGIETYWNAPSSS